MVANAGVLIWKKCVDSTSCRWRTCAWVLTFESATVEDYHRLHSVNSLGLFLCYKHAALKMQELGNKSGRIIGASSGAGRVGEWCEKGRRRLTSRALALGHPMTGVYSQTKFGVRGLTHAFGEPESHLVRRDRRH